MPEHRDAPDGIVEGVGRLLTEAEAEATLGRCGPDAKKGCICPTCCYPLAVTEVSKAGCTVVDVSKAQGFCPSDACGLLHCEDVAAGDTSSQLCTMTQNPRGSVPDPGVIIQNTHLWGQKWTPASDRYIVQDPPKSQVYIKGDYATKYIFNESGGAYTPEAGVRNKLTGSVGSGWTEEWPDGSKRFYEQQADGYGHITARWDRSGNAIYYHYDGSGRQIAIVSGVTGLATYMEYDGGGDLAKIVDYLGRTTYFEYSGGELAKVKRPSGCEQEFGYQGGRISRSVDADGHVTYMNYDGDGWLTKASKSDGASGQGRATYYTYPNKGRSAHVTDVPGRTTYYHMDNQYSIDSVKNSLLEDTKKGWTSGYQQSAEQDPLGNVTYMAYDGYGNMSKRTDPLGHVTAFEYREKEELLKQTDPLGGVREFGYDSYGNRTVEVDELGHTTYLAYNANNQMVKRINALGQTEYWEYDSYLERKSHKDARGNATTHGYQWNIDGQGGRRESTIDADGKQSYFLFDACDRQVKAVDELGYFTQSGYDGRGNRTVEIDKLGHPTYFTYNAFSEMVRQHQEVSGQVEETVTYFDAAGQVEKTYDAEGQASYFVHDAAGRQVQSSDALGRVTLAGYDAAGRQVRTVDPEGAVTYMLYDRASRQIGMAGPVAAADVKSATLQEGVAGYTGAKDTYLYRSHPNSNFATAEELYVFRNTYRSLLKFAIFQSEGGPVPDGAMIVSALLSIYKYSNYPSLVSAYEVLKDWVDSEATWNRASNLEEWDVGGCQAPGDDCSVERVDWNVLSYTSDQWMKLDVTRSLLRWTSGMLANRGWVLDDWSPNDTVNYRRYRSSDYAADSSLRPKLEIIYVERGSYQELDANGRATQAWSTGMGVAKTEYDAAGNTTKQRDALNNLTTFEHDALNRQKKVIAADGGETETEFDAAGNQTKVTDALGNETRFGYDKLNRQVWQRDAAGYFTYFEFTARSEQSKVKNPRLAETKSYFDAAGRLSKQTDPLNVTTYFYQDEAGRTTKTHLAVLDQVTYMAYDRAGRQTHTRTTPDGLAIYDAESVYNAAGQVERSISPRGYATYFSYDQAGRQTAIKDALGNETLTAYDAAGNATAVQDPLGNATYFFHDAANRQKCVEDALGNKTYFEFDANGNRTAVVDPLQRRAEFAYDNMNRVESSTAPDGGVTAFAFDKNGNLISVRDAETNTTGYAFDELSRLKSVTDALGASEYYGYDPASNLAAFKDARGQTTYYGHDLADRRTSVTYPNDGVRYFGYDAAANLVNASDARGYSYFTHDRMNRLLEEKAPDGALTGHAYDENSNRTRVTSPAGSTYFAFDEVDRMVVAQAEDASTGSAYFAFDAAGNVIRKKLGNGCFTYLGYDADNRVTSIRNCLPDGSPLAYFEHTYDAAGRITRTLRENAAIYFGYDQADRLTSEKWLDAGDAQIYAFAWDYDKVGNRTYENRNGEETFLSYNAANELVRLRRGSDWTYFGYDPRGNCLQIQAPAGTTYLEYNDVNLVTEIKYPGGQTNRFSYDALLRRYAMEDSSGLSYFSWDRNGMNLLCERDASGNVIAEYTHGYAPVPGIGSCVAQKLVQGGTTYREHDAMDGRGSVAARTDASGTQTAGFSYNAFGELLGSWETGASTRFHYQSNWIVLMDSNAEIYLSPTRVYHAGVGRFLGRDLKSQLAGDYLYAEDAPVTNVDSNGAASTNPNANPQPKPKPQPQPAPSPGPIWPGSPDRPYGQDPNLTPDPFTLGFPPGTLPIRQMVNRISAHMPAGALFTAELWLCILAREQWRGGKFHRTKSSGQAVGYSQITPSTARAIENNIRKYRQWALLANAPEGDPRADQFRRWYVEGQWERVMPFGERTYWPGEELFLDDLRKGESLYQGIQRDVAIDLQAGAWYLQQLFLLRADKAGVVRSYGDGTQEYVNSVLNCEECLRLRGRDWSYYKKILDKIHTDLEADPRTYCCPDLYPAGFSIPFRMLQLALWSAMRI